jgi:carbon-monoxide dehydrogenase large subunit
MSAATESGVEGAIGLSPKRIEDDRFIRGKGTYVDDVNLLGMLYLAIY